MDESEQIILFTLKARDEDGPDLTGRVVIRDDTIYIHLDGHADSVTDSEHSFPVLLENEKGEAQLIAWADINQEDPTHMIVLSGARLESELDPAKLTRRERILLQLCTPYVHRYARNARQHCNSCHHEWVNPNDGDRDCPECGSSATSITGRAPQEASDE